MANIKLRDLRKGDNVSVFGAYDRKKYTIEHVDLRMTKNEIEVVSIAMKSDDGHVRVTPYMSSDSEVTLWEENTTSTEFHIEEVVRMLSSITNSVEDIEAKSLLMQAVDYVSQAYNSLRKELNQWTLN